MTKTLTQMRTRVRNLLDDNESDTAEQRWSDSEIDFALESALDEFVLAYCDNGGSRLDTRVESAVTAGVLDLSSYDPVLLRGVEYKSGSYYLPLEALANYSDTTLEDTSLTITIRVTYVPKASIPASAGDNFVYGAGASATWAAADNLMACLAAKSLLPKDGERNPALEMLAQELWSSALASNSIPRGRTMSLDGRGPGLSYEAGLYPPYHSYYYTFNPGTQELTVAQRY